MSDKSVEKAKEELLEEIILDWRALKPKRQKRRKFKEYQEQLLKEIPGAADRTNVAMHAVIDVTAASDHDDSAPRGMEASTKIRNQALIHYIARLASSNNDNDEFDFSFVESLLKNGADINTADRYGQTIFHEVARSWNVDVARFLLNRGANINQQDKYGRAPLHVAAAVDYTEMIEFLLKNNADIDITTFGELQTPIHFAAKNDACQALKLLINYGSNVNCRDYQNRTPLQVAASMSRAKAARFLVELGTPTGVYDHNGEMTLSLLILKMPEVAAIALDQFRSQDMINRKEYNFLNYIEGPRILEDNPRKNRARSPLEIAIQYEQYSIVMHPVMKELINVKWEIFGKKGARVDLIVNVVFVSVWTILGITMPLHAHQLYWPFKYAHTWWRLLFAVAAVSLTGFEMYKQVSSFMYMNRAIRRWKTFREKSLCNDKQFCHPKWRDENEYLDKELRDAREERFFTRQDGWVFLDWIALLLVVSTIASHVSFLVIGSKLSRDVHVRILSFVLIILYVRLLKFTRPFEGPGPFVASIAPMLNDFLKWCVLFFLFFIPYASIFWMIFGPTNENYAPFLSDIPGLIFTVFSMAAFSNLSTVDELVSIDKNMARVLVGTFVAVCTVVILNLLIAMLADTFTRMYENSLETATMQRAKTILYLEQKLSSSVWRQYCEHVNKECSPEVCRLTEETCLGRRDKKRSKEKLMQNVEEMHHVINERFGSRVGKQQSDMDKLLEGVDRLNDLLSSPRKQSLPLANPSSINLNIIWNPGLNGVTLTTEKLLNAKVQFPGNHNVTNQETGKTGQSRNTQSNDKEVPCSCNHSIQRQLDIMLNLMKDAIKNEELNVTISGKTLVREPTQQRGVDLRETLFDTKNTHVEAEITQDCVDGALNAPGNERIGNFDLSPVLLQFENEANETSHGSVDLYTSDDVTPTPSILPADQASINSERLSARYGGTSFTSTSSTEGNNTCDENGFSSSQTSVVSTTDNVHQLLSPNPETIHSKVKHQPMRSYKQFQLAKTSSHSESGCSPGAHSSESDISSHEIESKPKKDELTYRRDFVSEDDFSTSSQDTDITDQSYDYINANGGSRDHYACTKVQVNEISESTSPERSSFSQEAILPNTPRVRWADIASDPGSTPFLNIWEISASSSDHFSGEARLESDAASGDERCEMNISGKQTNI